MSMRWMEGWEWVTVATSTTLEGIMAEKWNFSNLDSGTTKGSIGTGPGPNNHLAMGSGTNDVIQILLDDNPDEVYISFRFKPRAFANSVATDLLRILSSSGNEHFSINVASVSTFRATRLGSVRAGAFNAHKNFRMYEWNHMELYIKVGNSPDGEWALRINGTELGNETGVDTRSFTAGVNRINIRNPSITTNAGWLFKDIIVVDGTGSVNNDYVGEYKHVYQLLPTADTADEDWTLSTGSDSFDLLDDVDRNTSEYIESSVAAEKTLCDYANTGSESGIIAVSVNTTAALDAGTTTENFKAIIAENGTEGDGATQDVTASATQEQFVDIFENNPDTGSAWTASELDGASAGVEYI